MTGRRSRGHCQVYCGLQPEPALEVVFTATQHCDECRRSTAVGELTAEPEEEWRGGQGRGSSSGRGISRGDSSDETCKSSARCLTESSLCCCFCGCDALSDDRSSTSTDQCLCPCVALCQCCERDERHQGRISTRCRSEATHCSDNGCRASCSDELFCCVCVCGDVTQQPEHL